MSNPRARFVELPRDLTMPLWLAALHQSEEAGQSPQAIADLMAVLYESYAQALQSLEQSPRMLESRAGAALTYSRQVGKLILLLPDEDPPTDAATTAGLKIIK